MEINRYIVGKIIKYLTANPDFYFPFRIVMVKNELYDSSDGEIGVEIYPSPDLDLGVLDFSVDHGCVNIFYLFENLANIDSKTTALMAKGFLDEILSFTES